MEADIKMEREIINKLGVSLSEIRNTFDVSIFGIIKRSDEALWDIVAGGHNLDSQENLIQIANIIRKNLQSNELRKFSRLVLLDSTDDFVKNLRNTFSIEQGDMELQNAQVNNIFIKHAYLLYSK